jgi:hypothetical protein
VARGAGGQQAGRGWDAGAQARRADVAVVPRDRHGHPGRPGAVHDLVCRPPGRKVAQAPVPVHGEGRRRLLAPPDLRARVEGPGPQVTGIGGDLPSPVAKDAAQIVGDEQVGEQAGVLGLHADGAQDGRDELLLRRGRHAHRLDGRDVQRQRSSFPSGRVLSTPRYVIPVRAAAVNQGVVATADRRGSSVPYAIRPHHYLPPTTVSWGSIA